MTSDSSDFARQDDPLAAIGASLTAAAHRRTVRLRRRRRGLFAATAATATLALTGGAFAVTGTSTGVPALDRLIGAHTTSDPWKDAERLDTGAVPPEQDRRPRGELSPTVDIPLPDGRHVAAAAYETHDGMVCSLMADPEDSAAVPRGGMGCTNIKILRKWLRDAPAQIRGGGGSPVAPERWSIHSGIARGDVVAVTVGVEGEPPVEAVVSGSWQPPSWNGTPLRAFFAVLPTLPREKYRSNEIYRWLPRAISAHLADGTVVELPDPSDETRHPGGPSDETGS